MGKKINIEIKDSKNLEFALCEDAKKGDFICINDINDVNLQETRDFLYEEAKKQKEKIVDEIILKEKNNWINEFRSSKEFLDIIQENISLKEKINEQLKNKELELENKYLNQINELKNQITNEKHSNLIANEKHLNELNTLKHQLFSEHEKEINEYKLKIEELQRSKKYNIKLIGEEFENWIYSQMQKHFSFYNDVKFRKITKTIENEKADFLFEIINDGEIVDNVVIEAKTAENEGKTKNANHFAKLNKAYINNHSSFAILVTELEPNDEFTIRKINDYENMYMVRPEFLHIILDLVRIVMLQKNLIRKKTISFKEQEQILREFEEFKDAIINNAIKNIANNMNEILKQAETINKSSQKIIECSNKIINTHLETVVNKINNFNINNKIIKKIDRTNENEKIIETNDELIIQKKI